MSEVRWRVAKLAALVLGISFTACPPPPDSCRPPSVRYMGQCLPPCIEGDVNYCALPDGAVFTPPDGDSGSMTDVVVQDAVETGVDALCADQQERCGANCVDVTSDLAHCGRCGNQCADHANGTAVCERGTCGLRCAAGFGDCDGNLENGCEANLNTSDTNCGRCGASCTGTNAPANATPQCTMGACTIASCNMGFGDCDLRFSSGCESNLNDSAMHCGSCGMACPARANAAPSCGGGSCGLSTCNTGFANCDMNAANGCETNTDFSVMNCGRCGNVCPSGANGGPACVSGACTLSCAMGFRLLGGVCVLESGFPRPVAPISLGDVTLRRPTLRWELTGGFDGAVVELCRDRECTMRIETLLVTGTSARPTMDLPARSVVFWRLRGRVGVAENMAFSPTWLFHVPAANASAGVDTSFGAHNDVNGDGFDDLVVGSPYASPGARTSAGSINVFHGAAGGVSPVPSRTIAGAAANENFGISVRGIGDVNGDGFGDVAVGATGASPGGRMNAGTAAIFHGSPLGLNATATTILQGIAPNDQFGVIGSGGDVNADGFADLIVGAAFADPAGRVDAGTVGVYHGGVMGIGPVARTLEGPVAGELFGLGLAGVGDINGDGFGDIAVGSPSADTGGRMDSGAMSVFSGSAVGIGAAPARVVAGLLQGDGFGQCVSSAGDVNGDGYGDLAVGAPNADPGGRNLAGSVSVFNGAMVGIGAAASRTLDGTNALEAFGRAISAADVNGDGFSDLIASSPGASPPGRSFGGIASVFHGSGGGVAMVAARVLEAAAARDAFGTAVTGLDVNGDGFGDVAVGARFAAPMGRVDAGTATVFHGSNMGVNAAPARTLEGATMGENFGQTVASVGPGQRRRSPSRGRRARRDS